MIDSSSHRIIVYPLHNSLIFRNFNQTIKLMKTQFRRIIYLIILAIFALTILGFSILIALRGNLQAAALTLA